jgi:hypothetical protein
MYDNYVKNCQVQGKNCVACVKVTLYLYILWHIFLALDISISGLCLEFGI